MIFFACTVYKQNDKDLNPGVRVRYKVIDIERYQEFSPGSIIYIKDGGKIYVKETIEELDLILNGANEKTVGLLYGDSNK